MSTSLIKKQIVRPPVITVMGHVDHGKSTLLDYIRKTNTTSREVGGITQYLSAYEVEHQNGEKKIRRITFLDTPGHAAFREMRSRGAHAADVAILVISAEDGVKAQTLEALEAIKESSTPYIIAINKIDKPNADIEKVKQDLAEHGVYLEGYGGDIPFVPISAKTGQGVSELLDLVILSNDLQENVADPDALAEGLVIESHVEPKKGISATLLILNGTLKQGMFIIAGNALTPTRIMEDFAGQPIKQASFSSPVQVVGFSTAPAVGSLFQAYQSKKEAETAISKQTENKVSQQNPHEGTVESSKTLTIPIIIKGDVYGTAEAVEAEVRKINIERITIKIINTSIGIVTENDVRLAGNDANAIILGFNVGVDERARAVSERENITVALFNIIYKLTEWLKETLKERAPKITVEERTGLAKIIRVFSRIKDKQVIGGEVLEGSLTAKANVKILRRDAEIGRGKIIELQQQKTKSDRVENGAQFGLMVESKIQIAPNDKIEAFEMITK